MRLFNPKKEEVLAARDVLLKHGFDFYFHTSLQKNISMNLFFAMIMITGKQKKIDTGL